MYFSFIFNYYANVFHHFHFSFSLLLFMLLYNINIIILSFMDLTSLLILLLSQHLISQFSSNRNWNFSYILSYFFIQIFMILTNFLFFAHIEIIINISLCVISSVSFHSVSYFFLILKICLYKEIQLLKRMSMSNVIHNQSLNCDYESYFLFSSFFTTSHLVYMLDFF